jgi:hypothetical protein
MYKVVVLQASTYAARHNILDIGHNILVSPMASQGCSKQPCGVHLLYHQTSFGISIQVGLVVEGKLIEDTLQVTEDGKLIDQELVHEPPQLQKVFLPKVIKVVLGATIWVHNQVVYSQPYLQLMKRVGLVQWNPCSAVNCIHA